MAERRKVVPDNSVLIPASFNEQLPHGGNHVNLTARAAPLADAIRSGHVRALAPDNLLHEFLEVAYRKARPRDGPAAISAEQLQEIYVEFLSMPIESRPAPDLAAVALDLTLRAEVSPSDSWYVACALDADAELWLSHGHKDGLAGKARAAGCRVFTLVENRFRL